MDIYNIEELLMYEEEVKKMAYQITNNKQDTMDLVQSFYIKYINNPPFKINKFYIWTALNNLFFSEKRKEKVRLKYIDFNKDKEEYDEYDKLEDKYKEFLYESLLEFIDKLNYYDRELYKMNQINKVSVNKIYKLTKIPEKDIRSSINKIKKIINDNKNNIENICQRKIKDLETLSHQ